MANLEELVVTLTAETSQLRTQMSDAVKVMAASSQSISESLGKMADEGSKKSDALKNSLTTMFGVLGADAVKKGFELVKDGFEKIIEVMGEAVDASAQDEAAFQRLANSMQLAGNYSEETQLKLQEFSGEMERLTGVQADVIANNMSLLESLTKLKGDGLQDATKVALDLSAALGKDLGTTTMAVAKAIEGNAASLNKWGIDVEVGTNKAQNLKNVVQALGSQFEGSAAGGINTFAGATLRAGNAVEDLEKGFGAIVVGNPVVMAMMKEFIKIIQEMTVYVESNSLELRQGFASALIFTADVIGVTAQVVDILVRSFIAAGNAINLVGATINETSDAFLSFLGVIEESDDPFKDTRESFKGMTEAFEGESTLDKLTQKMADISNAGQNAFGSIKESGQAVEATTRAAAGATEQLSEAEQARLDNLQKWAEKQAEAGAAVDANYKFQQEVLNEALASEQITKAEFAEANAALARDQLDNQMADLEEARQNDLINEEQYQDAKKAIMQKQTVEELKANTQKVQAAKEADKEREQNLKSTFGTIATLASSSNAELAAIGKAAAVTTATIDGIAAVQKALASAPPPFNFALAALVGAATAANVAKIAGVGLKDGITEVPGVGPYDNFPAVLAPGERVVDRDTNTDLKAALSEGGLGGEKNVNVTIVIQNHLPASRQAGEEMIEAINEAISGGSLRILGT